MANTYTQIYIHIVFAVQGRRNLIPRIYKDDLCKYATGIIRNRGQKVIAINNEPDHMHTFIGMQPTVVLSDLVRDLKAGTSGFIIHNQEKHHRKKTFKDEYLKMLQDFAIQYDERYLFRWIEDEKQ